MTYTNILCGKCKIQVMHITDDGFAECDECGHVVELHNEQDNPYKKAFEELERRIDDALRFDRERDEASNFIDGCIQQNKINMAHMKELRARIKP